MIELDWLAPYMELLNNEALYSAVRFIVAAVTITLSLITFYLKLKDRSTNASAKLARASMSWDASSKFPICPTPEFDKVASYPFISSDLNDRKKADCGWYTVTELFLWNAGKGIVFGPTIRNTSVAELCVPKSVGAYEIRHFVCNDPEMKFSLGQTYDGPASTEDRIPIAFDFMHADKGLLISIWHNAANGEGIRFRAFSEETPNTVFGIRHVFRPRLVKFMNWSTDLFLIPAAILTTYLFYVGDTWLAVLCAFITWIAIWTAYTHRSFIVAPNDLRVDGENVIRASQIRA